MARQNRNPVQFNKTTRGDRRVGMTSGRAGVCLPIDAIPVLRGDSGSGTFTARFDLAEMPKPLMNAAQVNVQAWFIPKSAHPQFAGYDEFMHSYHGEVINELGGAGRTPPEFFSKFTNGTNYDNYRSSLFAKTLGLHLPSGQGNANADLLDAYKLVYNFRAAAHSSRIPRDTYVLEDEVNFGPLHRAFWPTGKFQHIVPDYESALVLGQLDLDVLAGQIPVSGLGIGTGGAAPGAEGSQTALWSGGGVSTTSTGTGRAGEQAVFATQNGIPQVFAQMTGQSIGVTLADIDKARVAQAYAELMTTYAGNDATGFDNDDVLVAELMQGFTVPDDMFKRPWLLDSKRVTFGMIERHATDAANLDVSSSTGSAQVSLSLNLPKQDVGGWILIQAEVLPERVFERQGDWAHRIRDTSQYPDALRDTLRPEPVDLVRNWRIDNAHTANYGLYGYEPMNAVWDRDFTVLGGKFFQPDPSNPYDEARAAVWLAEVVDPEFTEDHYLAPSPFPHDVFSDTLGDAVEIAFRHDMQFRGLTQIGDVLVENNDEYAQVSSEV